jgi:hypothetical protein
VARLGGGWAARVRVVSPTAVDYLAAGLALVPIPSGLMNPVESGWNLEKNCIRAIEEAGHLNGKNIGIAHRWCGTCAIDVDDYAKALDWFAARGIHLDVLLGAEDAVQISSGRENRAKLVYRLPDGVMYLPTLDLRKSYGIGLELRCAQKDGTVTITDVLPPSIHELTHKPYVWAGLGDWRNLPELPEELLALWRELAKPPSNGSKGSQGARERAKVREGGRDNHLVSFAGSMRRTGLSEAAIYAALSVENQEWCDPPLPDGDVRRIARSVARYSRGAAREEPPIGEEPASRGTGKDATGEEEPHGVAGVPATRDSEAGIAQAFTRKHGDDWRYVAAWGKWLMWSGQQWIAEPTLRVLDLIRSMCLETAASIGTPSIKTRLSSVRTVNGADHLARMHRTHASTSGQWDADLWEANTTGGVVALNTGDIRPARREDYMTR